MALATNVNHIYISRLLSGVAGAGVFVVVPVYIAEISDKKIRGGLCASFSVICNIGIFVEFLLAEYMHFRDAAIIILIISLLFVIGFAFMPESPQYLLSKQRYDTAERAFKFFRGIEANKPFPPHINDDFESIKELSKMNSSDEKESIVTLLKHAMKKGVLRGIFMAAVVSHFPLLSGCFVLITYNQGIFKAADVKVLSVFWSSLAFAFIQIIASLFTAKFVDKVGRRIILIGSAFSSAICLAIFSAYMYVKTETNYDLSTAVTWITLIPLVALLVEVFVSSIGIIPVPNFYGPEILDQKVTN
jgi:MFS family permease